MTANPSTTSVAKSRTTTGTRYLEDLFMHACGHSRRVRAARAAVMAAPTANALSDATVEYGSAVSDFLASVASVAVERLRLLRTIAPSYYADDDDDAPSFDIEPDVADALARPLFEAAGILDDFVPWRELYPNYEVDAAAEAEAEA